MFTNINIVVNLEPQEIKNFSNITKINNYERHKSGFKMLLKNQFFSDMPSELKTM